MSTLVKKGRLPVLLLRNAVIILAAAGLAGSLFGSGDGFMNVGTLGYCTVQSNIWVLAVTVHSLVLTLSGKNEPSLLSVLRFVVAVAVTVTFIVFWTMLSGVSARATF